MKIFSVIATHLRTPYRAALTLLVLGAAALMPLPQSSNAQEVLQRIEAMVNDQIISRYDLDQRVRLIIAAGGQVQSQEELDRLYEQILKTMVDERLQLQETQRFELEIDQEELDFAYSNIARSFDQTPEQFTQYLRQAGSGPQTLYDQLRAEFAWQRLVQGRLGPQVVISDEEVEARLERMMANQGKYEYRLSEIYLIVDDPSRLATVQQTADRLMAQLSDGAQFALMAQQFSESSSAARGGDLGWVSEDQLAPELGQAVANIEVGQVAGPIVSGSGVYILGVTDRRRILSADPLDAIIKLHIVSYLFTPETTQEQAEAWLDLLDTQMDSTSSCDDIPAFAERMGATESGEAGEFSLRDLNPQLRPHLVDLEIGKPSQPVISNEGIQVFFICERAAPEVRMPTFDEVFEQLEQQRIAMMARRYLRDLRRDSIVDYK